MRRWATDRLRPRGTGSSEWLPAPVTPGPTATGTGGAADGSGSMESGGGPRTHAPSGFPAPGLKATGATVSAAATGETGDSEHCARRRSWHILRLIMTLTRAHSFPLAVLCFSLACEASRAQQTTATLLGTVVDSSGAAVVGVSVASSNLATNVHREALTDQAG